MLRPLSALDRRLLSSFPAQPSNRSAYKGNASWLEGSITDALELARRSAELATWEGASDETGSL